MTLLAGVFLVVTAPSEDPATAGADVGWSVEPWISPNQVGVTGTF